MRFDHSFCIAGVAMLASHYSCAQETRPEEIVVTSTALRETALDIAQPAVVLSGDSLRRQIAASVGETIASELGVSATYFGPSASRPLIRGLGGDRVLVLQDGVSALDVSSLSQDHAVAIEAVLADQIEILKGPATLLFGSGAVGGVINVLDGRIPSLNQQQANSGTLEIRADTALDERTAVGRLELGGETVRIHVDGFQRDTDDVEIPGYVLSAAERAEHLEEHPDEQFERGSLANSDSETRGGAFGVTAGTPDSFVGVSWSRFDTNYGVPGAHEHEDETNEPEHDEAAHAGVRIDMVQDRYDLKAERSLQLGALERVRLRGSYNDYSHLELEGAEVGTRFEQQAFDVRLSLDHGELAGWRGTLGTQFVETDFSAFGAEAFVPPSISKNKAVFAFEKRDFGPLAVEFGARAENQRIEAQPTSIERTYDETAYSFSGGAVWQIANDYAAALNLTRSQRHPQSAELFANGAHLAISRFEVGDDRLHKEIASTVDLTLHRHAEAGIHWSLSAFYNEFDDFIYALDTGEEADGLPLFTHTQADAEFYGFEGEVTFPIYARDGNDFEVRLASDYVRGQLKNGNDLPQLPPLRYGIELHYERGPLHVGLETFRHADQDRVATEERATEGYTMMDADVSYRVSFGKVEVMMFLRGANLLDEEARRHTSPLKEVAPLPGRSVLLGVRAKI